MRAGSLAHRVSDYFARCPHEALTVDDVATKFDAKRDSVRELLLPAVRRGYLSAKAKRGPRGWLLYQAGPRIGAPS